MKIFVDANVLVSVLNRQYPVFTHAARILSLADFPGFEVFTSPICLAIAFYFAEKKSGSENAKKKIAILLDKLSVAATGSTTVKMSVENPSIHDFEDGLEYYAAVEAGCEIVLTEDTNDFYFSEIPVFNCEDFLRQTKFPFV